MAIQGNSILKGYLNDDDVPTQEQFEDLIDSVGGRHIFTGSRRSSNQTGISAGTWTDVVINSADYDLYSGLNTSTGVYTVPSSVNGMEAYICYNIHCGNVNASTYLSARILINTGSGDVNNGGVSQTAGVDTDHILSGALEYIGTISTGDTIRLNARIGAVVSSGSFLQNHTYMSIFVV
jgi:hypothetical protein